MMKISKLVLSICMMGAALSAQAGKWVHYAGKEGPGKGKHIVFISGDEEYRSEEGLPMMAKILSQRHGFDCTVLFSQDPLTGEIDPNNQTNIPGLFHLENADMMVILARFRELPDADMKYVVDFLNSGKPIFGLRTSTHAFSYSRNPSSPYATWDWRNSKWPGGFGKQVLGETWVNHHGHHKGESTRGVINPDEKCHPILKGVEDVWGPTDVYGIRSLPENAKVLLNGAVLKGMSPDDEPVDNAKNNPMMPVAWVREYTGETGNTNRIISTTMGASTDLESEDLRRFFVNSCYWGLNMEDQITADSNVDYIGEYKPTMYGFNAFTKGIYPCEHELKQ